MTDRLKGLHVVFEHNIREDDAQKIINAILLLKGVIVVNHILSSADDNINKEQIKYELRQKLFAVLE